MKKKNQSFMISIGQIQMMLLLNMILELDAYMIQKTLTNWGEELTKH